MRLEANHASGEVCGLLLLIFHGFGLPIHLTFQLDDRRERTPNPIGNTHYREFRAVVLAALTSMAAIRLLLAAMNSRASSMAAPAFSAAAHERMSTKSSAGRW